MEIRRYSNCDFSDTVRILKESFPELMEIEEALNEVDSLDLDESRYIQLVAVENNKVVGYAIVSKIFNPIVKRFNYWIDYVCVDINYRRKGIAKKLLNDIEEIARGENVLYLQLTSSRFRTSARKLYLDCGFSIRESDIFRKVL